MLREVQRKVMVPMAKSWLPLAILLAGLHPSGTTPPTPVALALAPGRATCWWVKAGHVLTDKFAHYWLARMRADPRVMVTVAGSFPAARYFSIQVYSTGGAFLTGLTDVDVLPDVGSVNPFVHGTTPGIGRYVAHIFFGRKPARPLPGSIYVDVPTGATVLIGYRIYLPDALANAAGGVPLPVMTARTMASGAVIGCPAPITSSRTPAPSPSPMPQSTAPTTPSPTPPDFRRMTGDELGGYNNVDAVYLVASLPPTSNVYVVRFKAPTTPRTLNGEPLIRTTQVRYWSLCTYTLSTVARDCLVDEQVPLDQYGVATIVLGRSWDRPPSAVASNGITWMDLGTFEYPYRVILRQLLPAPSFSSSITAVPVDAPAVPRMGPYAPVIVPCSAAQFEINRCSS